MAELVSQGERSLLDGKQSTNPFGIFFTAFFLQGAKQGCELLLGLRGP